MDSFQLEFNGLRGKLFLRSVRTLLVQLEHVLEAQLQRWWRLDLIILFSAHILCMEVKSLARHSDFFIMKFVNSAIEQNSTVKILLFIIIFKVAEKFISYGTRSQGLAFFAKLGF